MRFQILSLSGGGYLGLYTATVLNELEKQIRRPIASCFDLLAGTSVGGIIALGLSAGRSAGDIQAAFEQNGSSIFSDRPNATTQLSVFRDLFRSMFSPKYSDVALRQTIVDIVGDSATIGDLRYPTLVPAVNLTKGKPQVFKTDHHPDFKRDHRLKIVDVALATSAAPTYFPIAEVGDHLFADGGLFANAPDLLALHEAEHFFEIPTGDIRILSIGTTTTQFSLSHATGRKMGILKWAPRLAQTILSSQQMDVSYILQHKLRDRYVRIDEIQSREQERDLSLDTATNSAQKTIRGLAYSSTQSAINHPMISEILENKAPPHRFYYRQKSEYTISEGDK